MTAPLETLERRVREAHALSGQRRELRQVSPGKRPPPSSEEPRTGRHEGDRGRSSAGPAVPAARVRTRALACHPYGVD
jgi:hypothetical protein